MTDRACSAMCLHERDDVAVALRALEAGEILVRCGARSVPVTVIFPIPMGHKLAMRDLVAGDEIRKYGEIIGVASMPVARGAHVHVHNIVSRRARVNATA